MKAIKYIISFLLLGAMSLSCYKQDDIYKQWIRPGGGYNYPAKVLNLKFEKGYKRLVLNWDRPMDPAVEYFIVYWNNYTDSSNVISYSDYADRHISYEVDNLEDRSYSFNVINLDEEGNRSVAEELIVSPYCEGWLSSRTERTVTQAYVDGDKAHVILTRNTNEMLATRFRYRNNSDELVELEKHLLPGENEIDLPDAMPGSFFEYASCFQPNNGLDKVWRAWTKSSLAISSPIKGSRWAKSATKGQILEGTSLEYIFDGKINAASRWHSSKSDSYKNNFPKILSFDTGASFGEEYYFAGFKFCQSTAGELFRYIRRVKVYVGDTPYDPNDEDYEAHFGIPFMDINLTRESAETTVFASSAKMGRYVSLVFLNSHVEDGYIDLWELVPYGYKIEDN